jgi:transcriptional regulator with XRE-family HTH domain
MSAENGGRKKIAWTGEHRARHKAVRELFKDKPSYEELGARGACDGEPGPMGAFLAVRLAMTQMRELREAAGLSLADVADRSGIDKATLSRLENGRQLNPTVDTLWRYARAIGKEITVVVCEEEPRPSSGKRPPAKKPKPPLAELEKKGAGKK